MDELFGIGLGFILSVLLWFWLWHSRDKNIQNLPLQTEQRRFWLHVALLTLPTILVVVWFGFAMSFLVEKYLDADTWHQIIVRDIDTWKPNLLYWATNIFLPIALPFSAFLYAITRLSYFVNASKIPYLMALILWYTLPLSTLSIKFRFYY